MIKYYNSIETMRLDIPCFVEYLTGENYFLLSHAEQVKKDFNYFEYRIVE